MKNSLKRIKISDKIYIIKGSNSKLQVSINGKTKVFSRKQITDYEKGAEKTYPKIDEELGNFQGDKVCKVSEIIGIVSDIFTKKGQYVKKGDLLLSISAMKVENEIISPISGKVVKVYIRKNQKVDEGQKLISIKR